MKTIKHESLVRFSAEQMYHIVNDIARYPEFLPWCKATRIISQSPTSVEAELSLEKARLKKSFITRNALIENQRMTLSLVKGPFKHFLGIWEFIPMLENKTLVSFTMEFEFDSKFLAFVAEPIFTSIADTMVEAFVKRAESLHAKD